MNSLNSDFIFTNYNHLTRLLDNVKKTGEEDEKLIVSYLESEIVETQSGNMDAKWGLFNRITGIPPLPPEENKVDVTENKEEVAEGVQEEEKEEQGWGLLNKMLGVPPFNPAEENKADVKENTEDMNTAVEKREKKEKGWISSFFGIAEEEEEIEFTQGVQPEVDSKHNFSLLKNNIRQIDLSPEFTEVDKLEKKAEELFSTLKQRRELLVTALRLNNKKEAESLKKIFVKEEYMLESIIFQIEVMHCRALGHVIQKWETEHSAKDQELIGRIKTSHRGAQKIIDELYMDLERHSQQVISLITHDPSSYIEKRNYVGPGLIDVVTELNENQVPFLDEIKKPKWQETSWGKLLVDEDPSNTWLGRFLGKDSTSKINKCLEQILLEEVEIGKMEGLLEKENLNVEKKELIQEELVIKKVKRNTYQQMAVKFLLLRLVHLRKEKQINLEDRLTVIEALKEKIENKKVYLPEEEIKLSQVSEEDIKTIQNEIKELSNTITTDENKLDFLRIYEIQTQESLEKLREKLADVNSVVAEYKSQKTDLQDELQFYIEESKRQNLSPKIALEIARVNKSILEIEQKINEKENGSETQEIHRSINEIQIALNEHRSSNRSEVMRLESDLTQANARSEMLSKKNEIYQLQFHLENLQKQYNAEVEKAETGMIDLQFKKQMRLLGVLKNDERAIKKNNSINIKDKIYEEIEHGIKRFIGLSEDLPNTHEIINQMKYAKRGYGMMRYLTKFINRLNIEPGETWTDALKRELDGFITWSGDNPKTASKLIFNLTLLCNMLIPGKEGVELATMLNTKSMYLALNSSTKGPDLVEKVESKEFLKYRALADFVEKAPFYTSLFTTVAKHSKLFVPKVISEMFSSFFSPREKETINIDVDFSWAEHANESVDIEVDMEWIKDNPELMAASTHKRRGTNSSILQMIWDIIINVSQTKAIQETANYSEFTSVAVRFAQGDDFKTILDDRMKLASAELAGVLKDLIQNPDNARAYLKKSATLWFNTLSTSLKNSSGDKFALRFVGQGMLPALSVGVPIGMLAFSTAALAAPFVFISLWGASSVIYWFSNSIYDSSAYKQADSAYEKVSFESLKKAIQNTTDEKKAPAVKKINDLTAGYLERIVPLRKPEPVPKSAIQTLNDQTNIAEYQVKLVSQIKEHLDKKLKEKFKVESSEATAKDILKSSSPAEFIDFFNQNTNIYEIKQNIPDLLKKPAEVQENVVYNAYQDVVREWLKKWIENLIIQEIVDTKTGQEAEKIKEKLKNKPAHIQEAVKGDKPLSHCIYKETVKEIKDKQITLGKPPPPLVNEKKFEDFWTDIY